MAKLLEKLQKRAAPEPARPPRRDVERLHPDPDAGLTEEQVRARMEAGQQNFDSTPATRTEKQIVLRNICTLFNLVNIIFFVAIIAVGSFKDTLFMAVVAANTAIGIFQEIRAKRSIDALSFLTAAKAKVIRGGRSDTVPIEDIVLDDIVVLSAGDQVPTDCVAVSGFCEADESFLTGESDAISKNIGDTLLAGSFIISGSVHARADRVSADNYISKISTSAKTVKKQVNSEIMRTMRAIVAVISVALIPISIILFLSQLALADSTFRWAQALMEICYRMEELPGADAFPVDLSSIISNFYARAGAVVLNNGTTGSVTFIGTVSPAGGNLKEPVTESTKKAARCFYALSQNRADKKRYPAVDPIDSYSKYLEYPEIIDFLQKKISPRWVEMVLDAKNLVLRGKEAFEQINILGDDGVPVSYHERYWKSELIDYIILQQDAFDRIDASTPIERQEFMLEKVLDVCHAEHDFETFEECSAWYKEVINLFRQMNYSEFKSADFNRYLEQINKYISHDK